MATCSQKSEFELSRGKAQCRMHELEYIYADIAGLIKPWGANDFVGIPLDDPVIRPFKAKTHLVMENGEVVLVMKSSCRIEPMMVDYHIFGGASDGILGIGGELQGDVPVAVIPYGCFRRSKARPDG